MRYGDKPGPNSAPGGRPEKWIVAYVFITSFTQQFKKVANVATTVGNFVHNSPRSFRNGIVRHLHDMGCRKKSNRFDNLFPRPKTIGRNLVESSHVIQNRKIRQAHPGSTFRTNIGWVSSSKPRGKESGGLQKPVDDTCL